MSRFIIRDNIIDVTVSDLRCACRGFISQWSTAA